MLVLAHLRVSATVSLIVIPNNIYNVYLKKKQIDFLWSPIYDFYITLDGIYLLIHVYLLNEPHCIITPIVITSEHGLWCWVSASVIVNLLISSIYIFNCINIHKKCFDKNGSNNLKWYRKYD